MTTSEKPNRFDQVALKEVFDLCLSCKACASECPSNVDVATLKAEFQYQYQEANGYSLRAKLFAHNHKLNKLASKFPRITNTLFDSKFLGGLLKKSMGIAPQRQLPHVYNFNFDNYLKELRNKYNADKKKIVLYIDEFTRYLDVDLGKDAIAVLVRLGYDVQLFYAESGRAHLSKGFLKQVKALVLKNIPKLATFASNGIPVIGLEPSAILTFRDEYKRFSVDSQVTKAISDNCFLIEEFLSEELGQGEFKFDRFTKESRTVKIHNHCHLKALSNQKATFDMLNLPENYTVSIITSGCCGMAGSFGYEKEHYGISMQIGELKLFPSIRKTDEDVIIAANGTSCRHQIYDGTQRRALHPISILKQAIID